MVKQHAVAYSTVYAMNFIEDNWPVQKFCLIQDFCTIDHWQNLTMHMVPCACQCMQWNVYVIFMNASMSPM